MNTETEVGMCRCNEHKALPPHTCPYAEEINASTNTMPKQYAIIDLDGTCSNAEPRKYLIDGSQKKNWERFYDLCGEDQPHEDIRSLVQMLHAKGLYIAYLTGRVERVREQTVSWLFHHGFPEGSLQMRPDGDTRQDCIVKAEMADKCGLTPANTLLVLDDRDQVVRMWRERGFRCLQVAEERSAPQYAIYTVPLYTAPQSASAALLKDELDKMEKDHIVSGGPGPLYGAGWAAACAHWAKRLRASGPVPRCGLDSAVP